MEIIHNIRWLSPSDCIPPHRVARPEQVEVLASEFIKNGWGSGYPALVGYLDMNYRGSKVQLLSGSHRWAASKIAELN